MSDRTWETSAANIRPPMVARVTHDFEPPYRRPAIPASEFGGAELPAVVDHHRCHCGRPAEHPCHNPEPQGRGARSLGLAHENRLERGAGRGAS